ncbi:ubiquitin carboxyl-terminal hydrolase MINDY-3-like [Gigantopelta aegis]|uniref:ubiquitin carboxyl-terminal hydrolase MINDY-3-like n=1 Tax=Gigantopelta aegis TaxID=1735272 RepID=UPI001B88A07F|nr:ubiquitin carboxyl-terminal hydrolase MINDY-3-like [Gigantopelta aegis]
MASSNNTKVDDQSLEKLQHLLWGTDLKEDVFSRWTQGFCFSEDEPTALVQHEGGPCAVIAPVQGFLIKNALFCENPVENLSEVTKEEASLYLRDALFEIMTQMSADRYFLVCLEDPDTGGASTSTENSDVNAGERSPKRRKVDQETFHSRLRCTKYAVGEETYLKQMITKLVLEYQQEYGVLLYLYSLLLSKGIEQVKNEVADLTESLIDGIHGHGSQSLINLLLTGRASSHVWDNEKDVSGLKLRGVQTQATIGFLTLLDHLKYCEVGWFLKNPKFPIWILGSETHLTVLFSKDKSLVTSDSPETTAKQVFSTYDPEGNGFISTSLLGDVLGTLELVSEKEYVDIMKTKLDSENLGIITRHGFMEEFFPGHKNSDFPRGFTLYHYNGLKRSCPNRKVVYSEATAVVEDEYEIQVITDTSPIKFCIQTKWPTIDLQWKLTGTPSLN